MVLSILFSKLDIAGVGDLVAIDPQFSNAIDRAGEAHPVAALKSRLRKASKQLASGMAIEQVMRRTKFVTRRESSILLLAHDQSTLAWALSTIGESKMERSLSWSIATIQILFFVSIAINAFMIAIFAISIFQVQSLLIEYSIHAN